MGETHSAKIHLLGAEGPVDMNGIPAARPARKRVEMIKGLGQILTKGKLTPAQAAKMRGRVG